MHFEFILYLVLIYVVFKFPVLQPFQAFKTPPILQGRTPSPNQFYSYHARSALLVHKTM